eukprot:GHVU01081935.1.p2 GENE.GHVU01081935.1~~GHVU01081935.1.p2  ORF type:complete len:106 (-),score=12.91 GHVU01081935.1:314-631(-)
MYIRTYIRAYVRTYVNTSGGTGATQICPVCALTDAGHESGSSGPTETTPHPRPCSSPPAGPSDCARSCAFPPSCSSHFIAPRSACCSSFSSSSYYCVVVLLLLRG